MAQAMSLPRVRLAAFYFCYFAALGAFLPYWPLYLQGQGYGPEQIGWLMAILPSTKLVSPSLWGWLADRLGKPLPLIRWGSFLALICFLPLLSSAPDVVAVAAVLLVFGFCWNATLPLFESLTLFHLQDRPERYGQIRLWGSIGFILSVWLLGKLLEGVLVINQLPLIMTGVLVGQWLSSLATPPAPVRVHESSPVALGCILRRGEVLAFFAAVMLLQVSHGPYYSFYSVYLDAHHYSDVAIGALWALGVVAEVVLFRYMSWFLDRYRLRTLFMLSLGLSAIRWLMIGWGGEYPGLLLLAQLLHAASFGMAHSVAIHFVHRHFKGTLHSQGQALYAGLSFGLGGAMGSLYSGEYWSSWGPQWVFTAAAVASLLALGLVGWKLRR